MLLLIILIICIVFLCIFFYFLGPAFESGFNAIDDVYREMAKEEEKIEEAKDSPQLKLDSKKHIQANTKKAF